MAVKIKTQKNGDKTLLELHGKIASGDAIKIARKLDVFARKQNFSTIFLDLSHIQWLDSEWLGVFIGSWKQLKAVGIEMIFIIPPGTILDIFKASKLDTAFTIIDSLKNYRPSNA